MRTTILFASLIATTACLTACSSVKNAKNNVYREDAVAGSGEPGYITVQHCLIAFQGSGTSATRTKEDAEKIALELFEQANNGEDFDAIVRDNTDDSPPGIYKMANRGLPNDADVFARDGMVPAFGDTGFPLKVGEFGLAVYDPVASPFGWHIVKRTR